jgi:cation-transporting P-type ATPase 13A2
MIELELPPWYITMFRDTVNVFYLYQLLGLIVWAISVYYKYATLIIVMMIYSLFQEFTDIRQSIDQLKLLALYKWTLRVRRRNSHCEIVTQSISSEDLVPGDVFEIPEDWVLPCDAIIISGETIMNEAMLTGESTPAIKTALQTINLDSPNSKIIIK